MNSREETIRNKAFEIVCSMIESDTQRKKLASQNYLLKIFEKMEAVTSQSENYDNRILEKLSWLAALISFHQDMFDQVIKLDLLRFIIKISQPRYSGRIRSNAVLAISMLTYNENLFDEIINQGVIDLVMSLCRDPL
jgi:hypothetical protein